VGDDRHIFADGEPGRYDILSGREREVAEAVEAVVDSLEGAALCMVRQHIGCIPASRGLLGGKVSILLAGDVEKPLATRALCDELAKLTAHGKRRGGHLTEREEAVLRLIAWGHTNKEIAARLSLSPKTIESYKGRFGKKLGLHGRTDMVRYALRRGWLNAQEISTTGDLRPQA